MSCAKRAMESYLSRFGRRVLRAILPSQVALGLAACSFADPARAADITWTNTAGGYWHIASNWQPNQVPGWLDTAWVTNSGTYTVTNSLTAPVAGLTVGGEGGVQTLLVHSGSLLVNGAGTLATNAVFWMEGGMLGGSGTLNLAGPFNWTGGSITGKVQCVGGTISTASGLDLTSGVLVNSGVLTASGGGTLWLMKGAVITNLPGATLDFTGNFQVYPASGGGVIVNNGLVRNSGNGTNFVSVLVTNTGTLLASAGNLDLQGGYRSIGGTNLALAPGQLTFDIGSSTLDTASLLLGDGTVSCWGTVDVSGTCNLSGALVARAGMLNVNTEATVGSVTLMGSATLGGTGHVNTAGPFNWISGTLTAAVQCAGGTFGGGMLDGGRLLNSGWLVLTNTLYAANGAVISNRAGGTLELAGDSGLSQTWDGALPTLWNDGLLRKSAGGGTSAVTLPFVNRGGVEVQAGTLSWQLGGTNAGTMDVSYGATLLFTGDYAPKYYWLKPGSAVTGGGTVVCDNAQVDVDGAFNITGTNRLTAGVMNYDGPASAGALTMTNGTLGGTSMLVVSGPLNWTGGTISGAVQCAGGVIASSVQVL